MWIKKVGHIIALLIAPCIITGMHVVMAESALENPSKASIAKHTRQNSGQQLWADPQVGSSNKNSDPLTVMRFSVRSKKSFRGAGTFDAKPGCSEDRIRQSPVYYYTKELAQFDIVFFEPANSSQRARAEKWQGLSSPYLAGALYNPHHSGFGQQLARFFDIQCLPTRVHFTTANGSTVEEHREGARAWD